MPNPHNPNYAPVAGGLIAITASVSSSASATDTPNGFRGLFFKASATVGFMTLNGVNVTVDAGKNVQLWIAGKFITEIVATASTIYAMI